jgi:hypothetical protein
MSKTLLIKNGDMVTDSSGIVQTVTGKLKAKQDLAEFLSISILPDGFGAGLNGILGFAGDASGLGIEFELRARLTDGFARFLDLQRSSAYNRTPDETFVEATNIMVTVERGDPRVFLWRIDALTASGAAVKLSGSISQDGG